MAEQINNATILHKRSYAMNTTNDGPKLPDTGSLSDGEIAINTHKGVETIMFKNDANEIVALQKEVMIGENINTDRMISTAQIVIDESIEDASIDVYSREEVNSLIESAKDIFEVVTVASDTNSYFKAIPEGKRVHVLFVNTDSTTDYTVSFATSYKTPNGQPLKLTVPSGGYVEVIFLNLSGTTYVRGC